MIKRWCTPHKRLLAGIKISFQGRYPYPTKLHLASSRSRVWYWRHWRHCGLRYNLCRYRALLRSNISARRKQPSFLINILKLVLLHCANRIRPYTNRQREDRQACNSITQTVRSPCSLQTRRDALRKGRQRNLVGSWTGASLHSLTYPFGLYDTLTVFLLIYSESDIVSCARVPLALARVMVQCMSQRKSRASFLSAFLNKNIDSVTSVEYAVLIHLYNSAVFLSETYICIAVI